MTFALLCLGLIPGVLYMLFGRKWICPRCGAPAMIPIDTPEAQKLNPEAYNQAAYNQRNPRGLNSKQRRNLVIFWCASALAITAFFFWVVQP